jgi:hypothetical protein
LTAVSAIVFFLGLLFGFQRPSRLLPLRLCATVFRLLCCTPFNPGAAFFISKRLFCQAAVAAAFCRFASSGFNTAPWRFVSSRRGARNLLRFRVSCQLASSTLSSASSRFVASATSPFRGEAASTTTALGVNFARRLRISSFTASSGASVASATSLFRPRGAASTTTALGVNRLRRPSSSHPAQLRRQCDFRLVEGRGFYHHRVQCQLRTANPYSFFQPDQEHPPPVPLRLPIEGARLLPPPRWESTRFFSSLFPLVPPGALGARMPRQGRSSYLAAGEVTNSASAPIPFHPRAVWSSSSRRENHCFERRGHDVRSLDKRPAERGLVLRHPEPSGPKSPPHAQRVLNRSPQARR